MKAWEAKRKEIGRGIVQKGTKTRAGLEAIGYPELVEEVKRLRERARATTTTPEGDHD